MYRVVVGLAIVVSIFVVWVSHQASLGNKNIFMDIVRVTPYGDKIGHFFLFALLSMVVIGATKFKSFSFLNFRIYWAVAAITMFALADEMFQHFSPNRTLDIFDFMAGVFGIITAQLVSMKLENHKKKQGHPKNEKTETPTDK